MLILLSSCLNHCKVPIKGIIHIGAHDCEEQSSYSKIGIGKDKVIWIEAMGDKVQKGKKNGFIIHELVVSDKDGEAVNFNITNNGQSSSILDFGTHAKHHPTVKIVKKVSKKTTRMDTFIENNNIDMSKYNFLNLDIQGVELQAIKGFGKYLEHVDFIYTEVNDEHVYKNCCLMSEIDEYLKTFGFSRVLTKMTNCHWGDAFYVKNK